MAIHREKAHVAEAPVRVFISATSKDLGTVRETIKQALLTMDCLPVEQGNFPPDYRSIHEMLEHKIARCEAVIHIVGCRFGAEPDRATLPAGAARRSYTQMEADIARQHGKKLYLFVCSEDFPYDEASPETVELQALQQAYRTEIFKSKTLWTEVVARGDIERKVRELQVELEKLKGTIGRHRRRLFGLLAALLLVLGGIGAGVWWWLPAVMQEKIGYDRSKAREQLVTDIKAEAQKQIAAAGEDWRKVVELEKERDQQLADLDRLLDRIQQTFDAGEATESYRKASNLLTARGADEALAYLQARNAQRQSLIESQANRRDREEADLRKLLREELLSASLLETKFQFDDAEAKYRQVMEKSGTWTKARNDFAWFLIQRGRAIEPKLGNIKLSEAVELCRATLTFAPRVTAPQDWARTQHYLGNGLQSIGTRSGGDEGKKYLGEAVAAYHNALEVRTREHWPQDWAMTQNNLGAVCQEIGTRSGGEEGKKYLGEAVAAYHNALEVRTREHWPQDWAMTQNNLGAVCQEIGKRLGGEEGKKYLKEAVAAYRNALEIYTRDQLPRDWAMTQNNLGNAFRQIGTRSGGEEGKKYLEEAVTAHRNALEVYTREQSPQQWATTQNDLGNALGDIGTRSGEEGGNKYLADAVAVYHNALEVRTRDQLPQDWAMTENNLGVTLVDLGTRSGGEKAKEYLEEAVTAFRKVLEVRTRGELPQDWAATQNNLGIALQEIGRLSGGAEGKKYLEEAVAAYRNALEVYTREPLPEQWAGTQNNLGNALGQIGRLSGGAEGKKYLEEAVAAYHNALEVYTVEANAYSNQLIRGNLDRVQEALSKISR